MDIERLFEETLELDDAEKMNDFLSLLLERWVYFFFNEKEGKDTKPGRGNVESIMFTGKDNPINIPLIENELGRNGVIYTNLDLALRSAEFNCKVGKMKGAKALKMFYEIREIDAVYIQTDTGNVRVPNSKIAVLIGA